MPRRLLVAGLLLAAALGTADRSSARQIAADLSLHEIEITAGFDGAELLLFGHDETKGEVLVIVRGPDAPVSVRRKERVAGVWVNREEVTFDAAPTFYYVSVTDGLVADGALDTILERNGLGARFLTLTTPTLETDPKLAEEFRMALIELRARLALYAAKPGRIAMRDDGLFRTTIPFPAATPIGEYTVSVYHIVDGWPVAGASTPLIVRKAGFGAFVFRIAHEEPALYGLIAILVALGAGWLGGYAFRRT